MNKSFGASIWKVINSPIIVVILALTIWPILTTLTASFAVSNIKKAVVDATGGIVDAIKEPFMQMGQENKVEKFEKLNIIKVLEVKNIKTAPASWPKNEKIIGTILNNSDKTLTSFHINASFYDKEGNLIDVVNQWLSSLGFVLPNQSIDFSFERSLGSHKESEDDLISRKSGSIKIIISDFDIVEKDDKTK